MSRPLSIEVMVLWGSDVLHVDHLTPPRPYSIGESEPGEAPCDYAFPRALLGIPRARLLSLRGGTTHLLLLPRAKGTLAVPGSSAVRFSDLAMQSGALPSMDVPGAFEVPLPAGSVARMRLAGSSLAIEVRADAACERIGRVGVPVPDAASASAFGTSFVLHAGVLGALALFLPPPVTGGVYDTGADLALIQRLLGASADGSDEGSGRGLAGLEGDVARPGEPLLGKNENQASGAPSAGQAPHRQAVEGPADSADLHIAREAELAVASRFGMIGVLQGTAFGKADAPTAPWGRDDALGTDPASVRGGMWGETIGESFGASGLGISGVGEGGGGRGEGISIGAIGTLGHASGCDGQSFGQGCAGGFAQGCGRIAGSHATRAPTLRCGGQPSEEAPSGSGGCAATVSGRLPPDVVQRIVRQNFGRFRLCYEDGLRLSPSLAGRVTVKFVIGRDGSVPVASPAGSDLPDDGVVSCVVRRFADLSFPRPEGGIVTVVYPIVFSDGA